MKAKLEEDLKPYYDKLRRSGCALTADGWTDAQGRPLLNALACGSGEAVFLEAINTSGKVKDAPYMAATLDRIIEKFGADNVVCVITDSAANCKAAGESCAVQFVSPVCTSAMRCKQYAQMRVFLCESNCLRWFPDEHS